MTVHRVRLLGDPLLRTPSTPVTNPRSPAVRVVVDDLKETLRDLRSRYGIGRGIAAPQIGAPMRILYVEMDKPWVLINPEIVDVGTEDFTVWDDCFCFINMIVRTQRAWHIKVRYEDLKGKTHTVELDGEMAELLQHELDHLAGVLVCDRPAGLDPFCLREEWNKHYANQGRYSAPFPRPAPLGAL